MTIAGNGYTLSVLPLVRSGKTVVLTVQLQVGAVARSRLTDVSMLSDSSDMLSKATGIPNGMGLVDTTGQKLYMPATRTKDTSTALCSPNVPGDVSAGDQVMITCTYAGVPDQVSELDVTTPAFGTFTHVPLR